MLKFLADVKIEKPIVIFLIDKGFDIIWIPDFDCHMSDSELLELANKEDRILITNDKDFGELVFLQKKITAGIILFRIKGQKVEEKIKRLNKILNLYRSKIFSNFTVITESKTRFTSLERSI